MFKTCQFFLLFLFVGCSEVSNDMAFDKYKGQFEAEAVNAGEVFDTSKVAVHFGELSKGNILAEARGHHEVVVREDTWTGLSESSREVVIFHELGHAILRRGHVTDRQSIMNPDVPSGEAFEAKRSYYLSELFTFRGN